MNHRHFECPYTVALYDTDAANMLFSANLIRICHYGYEQMMETLGFKIGDILQHRKFGLPVAHIEGDFAAKITVGEKIIIRIRIAEIGNSSYRSSYELVRENGSICATAAMVHVCVDPAVYKSKPLPDDLRQALNKYS